MVAYQSELRTSIRLLQITQIISKTICIDFCIFEKLQLSFSLYSHEVTITITTRRRIRTCFRINLHYTDTPLLLSTVQLRLLEAVTYYYCCSNPVTNIIQTLPSSDFSSSQLKNKINHNFGTTGYILKIQKAKLVSIKFPIELFIL